MILIQHSIFNFSKFVSAFIDFPKPLIGLINGPAVGVSVTVLGLFDAVYATDRVNLLSIHIHNFYAPTKYIFLVCVCIQQPLTL